MSPDLLDEPNVKGRTCRRLLNGLKIKSDLETEKFSHSEESSSFDHSDHEEKQHTGINSIKISKLFSFSLVIIYSPMMEPRGHSFEIGDIGSI